ncbi:MAG: ABC transporter ATP-binding protein [Anaerolineae bacterium]|nr:ABC transporter ATP-binding protein [Anaerolineae bacterium]
MATTPTHTSSEVVIHIEGLTKHYGDFLALDKLNLDVQRGEIFGYLGPNGAGKTTTIRTLLDLIRPDTGRATILGFDAQADSVELHRHVGFMPGELNLWKALTGKQVVHYVASVRGQQDKSYAYELAERLELDMSKRVRDLSSGNKRKLGLVVALMHRPEVFILDEPTTGLDPLVQQTFHGMMMEARDEGRTIFLSSHILAEVQAICDRVGILRDGQLKAVERVEDMTHVEFRRVRLQFRDGVPQGAVQRLGQIADVRNVEANGETLRFNLAGDFDPVFRAVSDGYIQDVRVEDPTLEEIFLTYYGGNNHRAAQNASRKEAN